MSSIIYAYLVTPGAMVAIILGALVGGVLIGLGLFLLISKLRKRVKKVKIGNSKTSDYQFQFKHNTGQFLSNLRDSEDYKE